MVDIDVSEATAAEANANLIRCGYDAFARGDIAGVLAIFAEDILWHVPGRGPISRDYRGHAEVLEFFNRCHTDLELAFGTSSEAISAEVTNGHRPTLKQPMASLRWSSMQQVTSRAPASSMTVGSCRSRSESSTRCSASKHER
jgi:hypothetical protein